jgi:N-acetylneuraminic acid mutarotase
MAFVMGGRNDNNNYDDDDDDNDLLFSSSTMERYDISSGQWSAATAMGTRRHNFGSCVVMGEVYVTGGKDEDSNDLSSVEKYLPLNDTWSVVYSLPEPRTDHAAVAVGSAMYVLGGYTGVAAAIHETTSVLKLDSVRGFWRVVAPMPEPRYDSAACVIGSDIYVFGGLTNASENTGFAHESVFKYETETDEWSTLAPMPLGDHGMSAIDLDGLIYIGGVGYTVRDFMSYDPVSGVWSNLASLIHQCYHGAFYVLGGCLYAAGGEGSESEVQRYDVTTNVWTEVADMLEGRCKFGAVTIGSNGPAEELDLFDSLITKAAKYK